jgi:hypothetical protein
VVALYAKEPRTTDKKILPVEAGSIPEELMDRLSSDQVEQLSLLSAEELVDLQRPSASRPPRGDEIPPPETARVRGPRRTKGGAIEDKLPGF